MPEKRIVVTLATQSHIPFARALAISVRETNPDIPVYVLLVDGDECITRGASEPFRSIRLSELPDQPTIQRMAFYYSAFEFCNAIKGHLGQYVSQQLGAVEWVYLDSDIAVFGSLDPLWHELRQGSIVLTAHCTQPVPGADVFPYERDVIKHGVFNGGLLALEKGALTAEFLHWFGTRLSRFAFYDDLAGTFVDQTWLTLVPCLFQPTSVCRHPGVNIGHWNLHERMLTRADDGTFLSNGQPVVCVHFSGWDFANPELISKFALPHLTPVPPGWAPLGRRYHELLNAAGYDPGAQFPYGFARFSDGRQITSAMRKGYLTELDAGRAPVDPFNSADYFHSKYPPRYHRLRRLLPAWMERQARLILGR
jgi:hypothetical protein